MIKQDFAQKLKDKVDGDSKKARKVCCKEASRAGTVAPP